MRSKIAFKNITVSLLLQAITVICGFVVPKLIIDSYGSDVNGLITSITQFLAYITLLESGVGPVVKARLYKPIAKKDNREIKNILFASERFFKKIAFVFIAYVAVLCFVYPWIVSKEFEVGFTVSLLVIIAVSTFAEYYFGMTYKLYLQAEQKTYVTSYFQIASTVLNTIGIVILIKLGCGVLVVKLLSGLVFVVRPLLQSWYVKKKYSLYFGDADKNYRLEHKWDGMAQHVAAVVHSNTDVVVLTLFTRIAEVSVYSVYMLVINGVKKVVEALTGGVDASFGDMIVKNETKNLKRSFAIYEFFYFSLITILFSCTLILILPFVDLYTVGVTDANYHQPVFAILIVLAAFMHSIRLPYSSITLAAGHFRETMKGAVVEALINIVLSVILVFFFGIVGVAIGTLVAMIVRTIEFAYHTSKYILKRSFAICVKRCFFALAETLAVFLTFSVWLRVNVTDYSSWIYTAMLVLIVSCCIVVTGNLICYKNDAKAFLATARKALPNRRKKKI